MKADRTAAYIILEPHAMCHQVTQTKQGPKEVKPTLVLPSTEHSSVAGVSCVLLSPVAAAPPPQLWLGREIKTGMLSLVNTLAHLALPLLVLSKHTTWHLISEW